MNHHPRTFTPRPAPAIVRGPVLRTRAEMPQSGIVKWYDPLKKFGFIETPASDVFMHRSVITQYGLREADMIKGVKVAFITKHEAGRRPEVVAIAFA